MTNVLLFIACSVVSIALFLGSFIGPILILREHIKRERIRMALYFSVVISIIICIVSIITCIVFAIDIIHSFHEGWWNLYGNGLLCRLILSIAALVCSILSIYNTRKALQK